MFFNSILFWSRNLWLSCTNCCRSKDGLIDGFNQMVMRAGRVQYWQGLLGNLHRLRVVVEKQEEKQDRLMSKWFQSHFQCHMLPNPHLLLPRPMNLRGWWALGQQRLELDRTGSGVTFMIWRNVWVLKWRVCWSWSGICCTWLRNCHVKLFVSEKWVRNHLLCRHLGATYG